MIRLLLHIVSSFVFILLILSQGLNAQTPLFNFEKLSLEEGLSQSSVSAIYQDKKGFLWFGTANGLNKYDGYDFIVYKHDPDDTNSLSNDMITAITEDREGMLWIGTEGGLNKFDPVEEKFTRYAANHGKENMISSNNVYSLLVDKKGMIWIGTFGTGLNKFDPHSGRFSLYKNISNNFVHSGLNFIRNIKEDKEGKLWLGTYGGVSVFDPETEKFRNYSKEFLKQNPDIKEEVYALNIDDDGIVWFGTDGNLNMFNPHTGKLNSYISGDKTVNTYFRIWALLVDSKGNVWLGTGENGIHIFNKKENSFTIIRNNPVKPLSLSDNSVVALYEDRGGVIWVGTSSSGINKYIGNKNKFKHVKHDPENLNTISPGLVFGIAEDKYGFLWVGTLNGLNKISKNGKVTRYIRKPDCSGCISSSKIRAIEEDQDGNIWIATQWGLNKYDRRKDIFIKYKTDPSHRNWLSTNNLSCLYIDREGIIWIGSFNYGLQRFDPVKETFKLYSYEDGNGGGLKSNRIMTLGEDNEGKLLIGTESGLHIFDKQSGKVVQEYRTGKDSASLSNESILSVYCDKDGIIWLGTYGGGLNKIDKKKQRVSRFSEAQGLPNNVVYGILPDDSDNLWLSTNKGLVRFSKKTNNVRIYDPSDGLQSYEFNSNAFYRSRSGELFFGGVNGYNSFFPEEVTDNTAIPSVVITSAKTAQSVLSKGGIISSDSPVELSYNQNFITFDFVSLDFTNPKKNKYAYKLEGLEEKWINSGNRRFVTYTNLEPGKYVFKVKASNGDEIWNEQGASFSFIIYPPFWQTWWFYIAAAFMITGAVISIHKYRVRLKVKQLLEIENMRKKIADDFHDELGHKLTKISLYSELMRKGLVEKPGEPVSLENDENYLKKINEAANTLFDDTKDFIWSIDPVKDTLYDLAVYLKDFGDELFDKSGIAFRVNEISVELSEINLPMDWKRQLILLFKEAMNNCLRHSECTNVELSVSAPDEKIEITLKDDGKGFITNNGLKGRGLVNMKARADKLKAMLTIESVPGKETVIRLTGELSSKIKN
ncbi:MAG: two-component regulator propeller domain-containing protein [Ignavibacteriaceae bacterium]